MARKRKRNKQPRFQIPEGRGFDLGIYPKTMTVPNIDFNQNLIDAEVLGCSYGYQKIESYPNPIPVISLIAKHEIKIKAAYEEFIRWGCEEDGDVVGTALRFHPNGSYELALGQDTLRRQHILTPNRQLTDPMWMNLAWIKRMDTTHAEVPKIAQYASRDFAPFILGFGVIDENSNGLKPENIRQIEGAPSILKHHLMVHWQDDDAERFPLLFSKRAEVMGEKGKAPDMSPLNPITISKRRKGTIEVAFPVTKIRLKNSGIIEKVIGASTINSLSESQILQACINCLLSKELCANELHYNSFEAEFPNDVWEYIYERVDRISLPNDFHWLSTNDVLHQITLDLIHIMRLRGVPIAGKSLSALQKIFLSKGYADD